MKDAFSGQFLIQLNPNFLTHMKIVSLGNYQFCADQLASGWLSCMAQKL